MKYILGLPSIAGYVEGQAIVQNQVLITSKACRWKEVKDNFYPDWKNLLEAKI